jgi:hypothetical protein
VVNEVIAKAKKRAIFYGIFQSLEERAGQALEESIPDGYRKNGH